MCIPTAPNCAGKGGGTDRRGLRMDIYSAIKTMGPEGICPTLVFFGGPNRPFRTQGSSCQYASQNAIEMAKKDVYSK